MDHNTIYTVPFFITIPHSGEQIPPEAEWLNGLTEVVLMGDVDRYVDRLYLPTLEKLGIPSVTTEWHRYAADLNRVPEDIDCESVIGSLNPAGTFPRGFHWVYNTHSEKILKTPLTLETHRKLVDRVYRPFHQRVMKQYAQFSEKGFSKVFHIDAHSCPSVGTNQHRDPGQKRADIIISDSKGMSSCVEFKDLVISAYKNQGFSVSYNWPYFGGRLTENYGNPALGHHVIQVELNRGLYMDEITKALLPKAHDVSLKIEAAITEIKNDLINLI